MTLKRALRSLRLALLCLFLAVVAVQGWYLFQVWQLRASQPQHSAFMARAAAQREQPLRHHYVPYSRISVHAKRAVIGAEDSKFVEHHGFDVEGLKHAWEKNRDAGTAVAGGSTITQQLAKNLFLSGKRSYVRKLQEAMIALYLETLLDKRRILELYLNYAEWGNGVYGIEAAARHHFGVSAAQLDAWQSARLAAMLPKPRFYDRHGSTDWLQQKTAIVQRRASQVAIP
ncbi:MAG: monofunctional biosynthetic peptidoglycan transglycosylase [Alcanivoracaceae bacterium]|nr:monofunctional biosynthetic peptidoglycan transglycosylase [Alcanivoracaceae bacterium]